MSIRGVMCKLVIVCGFGAASAVAGSPPDIPEVIVSGEAGTVMNTYLTRLEAFGFNGSVLVAKGGEILVQNAFGIASVPDSIPNRTMTLFSTGSVTKQFTAAAIVKLAMEGKLSFDDSISKYFNLVPADKASITIHQLLTHTAGLAQVYGPDEESISRDEFIRRVMKQPLYLPVGERYEYSNAGYSLLAAIIEIVSGMDYEQYLKEKLFEPSGMYNTGLHLLHVPDSMIAHSHNDHLNYQSPAERPEDAWNIKGNGGILSTPADMYRWHQALYNDSLFSPDARKKLFSPYVREYEDGDSFYGYGWVIDHYGPGKRLIWHNGGAMPHGWNCAMYYFVDDDLTCIVFSNKPIDGIQPADDIVRNLAHIALGQEFSMPPAITRIDSAKAKAFAGAYTMPGNDRFDVRLEGQEMIIEPEGQTAAMLLYPSPYADRLPKYNDWTADLVKALATGDDDKALTYFSEHMATPEEWNQMNHEWWSSFDSLGAFKRVEPIATITTDGAQSYCRLVFEKGEVVCRFFWMAGKCGGIMSDVRLEKRFLPVSDSEFCSYDIRSGAPVRVVFSGPDALTVEAVGGRASASRLP